MHKIFIILNFMMIFFAFNLFGGENNATKLNITADLREKYPIKSHHERLSFDCIHCHDNQGNDPAKFKNPGDKGCLSCHESKEHMARRTAFMDLLDANPHNSIHDGPTLYCDECHMEHKKSFNMCDECHELEVKKWMRVTP